MNRNLN